ncbi:MAG: phosphohydrolase [Lachnospiraceae bacterium]|nr:phosphohydrolase [Lachnospiraceae bacterium]
MDFMTTYTGEHFTPTNPNPAQLNIVDIARSLSMLCRANGHLKHFYSVAQHCVNCANEAAARGLSKRIQLACLLHDGSEAYISDITRPVKKHLPTYLEIEAHLQNVVYEYFLGSPLTNEEALAVDEIDDGILPWEFKEIMGRNTEGECKPLQSKPVFCFVAFSQMEDEFKTIFHRLIKD